MQLRRVRLRIPRRADISDDLAARNPRPFEKETRSKEYNKKIMLKKEAEK